MPDRTPGYPLLLIAAGADRADNALLQEQRVRQAEERLQEGIRLAKQAGMRVMDLVAKDLRPRDIVTAASVTNAVAVDMALGGSTNTVLHLPAVFGEGGLSLTLEIFDTISRTTPNLCKLSPAGHHHIVEDLHEAGGIPAGGSGGSGRSHSQVPTTTMQVMGSATIQARWLPVENMMASSTPAQASMVTVAAHLALRDTARCVCQSRIIGPNRGSCSRR